METSPASVQPLDALVAGRIWSIMSSHAFFPLDRPNDSTAYSIYFPNVP